jgi:hypothetical protein
MTDLLKILMKHDPTLGAKIVEGLPSWHEVFPMARPADVLTHDQYVAWKHAQDNDERDLKGE